MNIKQLKITVFLKEDIDLSYVNESLSQYINGAMKKNELLSDLHRNGSRYKFYSFSWLMPKITNNVCKKGNLYYFHLNSPDEKILNEFEKAFKDHFDDKFVCCSILLQEYNLDAIKEICTITPCSITHNDKPLVDKRMSLIRDRILSNSIRKYNSFFCKNIEEDYDFIEDIEILNNIPQKVYYKKGSILGHRFKLKIKDDTLSQKLAFFIIQSGILEKNSLGLGYCKGFKGEVV